MAPTMFNAEKNIEKMSNEQYLIYQAKLSSEQGDPYASKAWMITARTMFPENFSVQYQVYEIEKDAKNIEEAARCFSNLFQSFPNEPVLWNEIKMITLALRSENLNPELQYYNEIFLHFPEDVQHQVLMKTAERTKDSMEHCKLLLLLIHKFPKTKGQISPTLIDTLLSFERKMYPDNALNCFRLMLVCNVLPLLDNVDLPQKLVYVLIHKALEFTLKYTFRKELNIMCVPSAEEKKIKDPWETLFKIYNILTPCLGWTLPLNPKETCWQVTSQLDNRQSVYRATIYFCHNLSCYMSVLEPPGHNTDSKDANLPLCLVEAFSELSSDDSGEPTPKRSRKQDPPEPLITVANDHNQKVTEYFLAAYKIWEYLHSSHQLEKEFSQISDAIKLDLLLDTFVMNVSWYLEMFDAIHDKIRTGKLRGRTCNLLLASIFHCLGKKNLCLENVFAVIKNIDQFKAKGSITDNLTISYSSSSGPVRHLHYLPLARLPVLQYCTKLLFYALKDAILNITSLANLDVLMGHLMVLSQLDWPQEKPLISQLCERIREKGSFHYEWFTQYVINIDILEEIMYLSTQYNDSIHFELSKPTNQQLMSQRRVTTRNVDKGVKEDLKATIRRQVQRCDEPIDDLIIRFINEVNIQILL